MKHIWKTVAAAILTLGFCVMAGAASVGPCNGHYPNPISDVCWNCFFPISIAGVKIGTGYDDYNYPPPICTCPIGVPPYYRVGVGMTYWSPDRVVEVVRTPMCSPLLNGTRLGSANVTDGSQSAMKGTNKSKPSFYHVHWMRMPLLQQLALAAEGELCLKEDGSMDYALLTEYDPLWVDDDLAFAISPEAVLFANPVANLACAPDVIKASVSNFGIDALFWCSGSNSVYPLSGNKQYHRGGVDAAMNMAHRAAFTLHRSFLLWDTSTVLAMCSDMPQPMMRKGQYKLAFMLPLPTVARAYGFGVDPQLYETGREIPYQGEDWAMMVWRRHTCCVW